MKHKIRACLSLFVCVCMLFGMMPVSIIEAAGAKNSAQQMEEKLTASTDSTQVVSLTESSDSEENGVSSTADSGQEETSNEITGSEEYLDQSVTVDISPLQDDAGEDMITALTGERLTAVVSAYNDNPNYTATATICIYVKKTSGNSEIELAELPEVTLSGAGSSDSTSAATVEAVWHEADGDTVTVPYLEVTIPSGASIVFYMTLWCQTGHDESASAQIYAEITETDEETETKTTSSYPENSSDRLTFTWTGEAAWSDFTKTASITAIGVADGEVKADEVDWSFSAVNNTTGSTGVIYTNYITMTDTLVLPDGLTAPTGSTAVYASTNAVKTAVSGKTTVGEIQDGSGNAVYGIYLSDTYKDCYTLDSLKVTTNSEGLTEISYSITIENPDVEDAAFNPISAISTSIYMSALEYNTTVSLLENEMKNTAQLTVYSVMKEESDYKVLYEGTDTSSITFDETGVLTVAKTVSQVMDGIGNVTYGYGLDESVGTALSNEKKYTDENGNEIPYVAQGYKVTYCVTIGSTNTTATDASMTDTIPKEMTLDESTIVVTSGTNDTLTKDDDYTCTVSKDESGVTTLAVKIKEVPANGSVVITYSCDVNENATTANTEIKNTVKVGDKEESATVKTPENGEVELSREIIQRTTTTTTGLTLKIYKDLDASAEAGEDIYKCEASAEALKAYFGMTNPSNAELTDAILKVNAGDTIEYLITVENNSLENVNGIVYESNLFSSVVEGVDKSELALASEKIGKNAGGWNYYIAGSTSYLQTTADSSKSYIATFSKGITTEVTLKAMSKYYLEDLEKNSNGGGINTDYRNGIWNFYGVSNETESSYALQAYTTYRQTTIVTIPGSNVASSAHESNAGYQNLVSSFAYYCTENYSSYLSDWTDYAFFVSTGSEGTATGSGITAKGSYVHTPERQIYLNTGTLASTVLEDEDDVSNTDGLIKELYYDNDSSIDTNNDGENEQGVLAANDYANSARYFTADENCYVVNYIYLFNDSSEEMNLNDYSISVVLPDGFEWVGFTYINGKTEENSDKYLTYSKVSDSVTLSSYFYSNFGLWVNNTRAKDGVIQPLAYAALNSGTTAGYYEGTTGTFPQTYSQKFQSLDSEKNISEYYDELGGNLTCSVDPNKENADTTIKLLFSSTSGSPTIAAYSGISVMYVAKVSDVSTVKEEYFGTGTSDAAATFQVYIERKRNSKFDNHDIDSSNYCMSQISPVIRAQDAAASSLAGGYRQYVSNDGNANSYLEHGLDRFYGNSSSVDYGGKANRIWSYVSLSMCVETTSVSVTKQVVKNSGEDPEDDYTNGATISQNNASAVMNETGGFASDYDDYYWPYSLYDGLHRTVDGTVTWKATITNTGEDTTGNTETSTSVGVVYDYSAVDYSTLVEVIDSPYHLIEIAVPNIQYANDKSMSAVGASYQWVYFELPDADPESKDDMVDAGWEYDQESECYYYEVYAKNSTGMSATGLELKELTTISTKNMRNLYIRVTVRCLKNGSVGYGYDVYDSDGNQNTCAYQYLIEFVNPVSGGYPFLFTKAEVSGNSNLQSSVELYLTFSTDDSIETNYNSFGLALKDVQASDVTVTDGESTTVYKMHNEAESMSLSVGNPTSSDYSGKDANAGSIASDTVVVQANDWTDTSYTYGEKTLTVLDDDGNVAKDKDGNAITVNSRKDGNMTLPSTVTAGTTIHNTLKWESVLYESENYSGVTNLVLYDVYGVQADESSTGEVMSGYDVDFSSITVKLCLTNDITANNTSGYSSTNDEFAATELVLGTDYEIYYTTEPLVTKEHHPIAVNSYYYAADLDDLNNVTWVKYDPGDPDKSGDGAMGFKIVLLTDGDESSIWKNAKGTIWNGKYTGDSDWVECEIYVDYNATVSDSVIAGECYPNVMAWTADVLYPTTDDNGAAIVIEKPIQQDTTAMFFKASEVYVTLSKTVVDEDGNNVSSGVNSEEEFTYLVFRTNCTSHKTTNLTLASNITGIAAVTIRAGEVITPDDNNLTVLYNNYDTADNSAEKFWDATDSYYYYIVEIDSGNYTEKSISIDATGETDTEDVSGIESDAVTGLSVKNMTSIAATFSATAESLRAAANSATDVTEKAELEAQASLYQTAATYLNQEETANAVYFSVSNETTSWEVTVAGVNYYTAPTLEIRKTDTDGNVIMNEVTFEMLDADGNTVSFTETSGGYAYAGTDSGSGGGAGGGSGSTATDLVFNGTTSVTGLPEGTYYLVETSAPAGYVISDEKTEFTIAAKRDTNGNLVTTVEVSVKNEEDSTTDVGSVKLVKVDEDTELAITGTDASASFQIYSSKEEGSTPLAFTQVQKEGNGVEGQYTYSGGSGVTTISTDAATGELLISGLPYGTYYLVETSPPEGYLANHSTLADAYEFTVSRTDLEMEIDFPNTHIQAEIVITKTDTSGNAITGNPASFVLTDEDENQVTFSRTSDGVYSYDKSGTVTTLQTSSVDGTLTLKDLPKGKYTLTETAAPKGYEISTGQETVTITVEDNTRQTFNVTNETASMRLRIVKMWKLEGSTKTYALSGVKFTLYQVDLATGTASEAGSGMTDGSGVLDLENLDWSKTYYLYEEVPEGYSASSDSVTVYRNDTTGEIDLSVTEIKEGYTAISCIYIDMAATLGSTNSSGEEYCTYTDDAWIYTQDVLNVKNATYGGLYASTSYKTISNAKSAAVHEDLEEQTGYSYFYQESDYAEGHYNYVSAIKNGDTVTYTLNISNVSDYEFSGLVIIDRLPETDDTGIVNSSATRRSEFSVTNPSDIVVTVNGKEVSTDLYTVTYSSNVKFTDSDFNGTTEWNETWISEESKSFRIVFDSSFSLEPGQTLVVTYDGVVGEDAEIGQVAWNNFAYRYTVYTDSEEVTSSLIELASVEEEGTAVSLASAGSGITGITLTPEPPKVGVSIQGMSYKVTKKWEDDADSLSLRPDTVTLKLRVADENGELTDTETENGTVKLTCVKDQSGGDETISAEIVDEVEETTVKVEASLDEDGNWVCQWSGLPILDDGYSYIVEETDTGSVNYVWSFAKETVSDGNGGTEESVVSGVLTNTLKLTTLNLKKQDSDGSALSGAQFTLERQTETGEWEAVEKVYTVQTNAEGTIIDIVLTNLTESELTTDDSGTVTIAGLPAGTYRITEVKTKEGYTLLTEPLVVKLPIHYTEDETAEKGIDVTGSEVYLIGGTYYFYDVTYTITNTANFAMPSAGWTTGGEWVSGLLGAALLAGAWILLWRRRRNVNPINHLPCSQRVKCSK